jgi:hypothetical protein
MNQSRRDRIEEQDILQRLREEVEQFVIRYPRFLQNVERKKEALDRVAQVFEGQVIENNFAFLQHVRNAGIWGGGVPLDRRITFDEFVSTGKLGLIKNKNLRTQIMGYYDFVSTFQKQSDLRSSDYFEISFDLIPREGATALKEGLSESKYAAIVSSVLDSDLHLEIVREQNKAELIEDWWKRLAAQATALLEEIDAELEGK